MNDARSAGMPTWRKYVCMSAFVERMCLRDKRRIFQLMRTGEVHEEVFLPHIGLTFSEFATFQVFCDSQRRTARG